MTIGRHASVLDRRDEVMRGSAGIDDEHRRREVLARDHEMPMATVGPSEDVDLGFQAEETRVTSAEIREAVLAA